MENKFTSGIYNRSPVFIQNILVTLAGYLNYSRRFNKTFWEHYNFLRSINNWSLVQLKEYQEQQLLQLVKHAYNTVPYYKGLFDSLGITSGDIKSSDDFIRKIPILDKETIHLQKPHFLSSNYSKKSLFKMYTSGTTGKPLCIYNSLETIPKENAFVWDRGRNGLKPGQRYATFNVKLIVPIKQMKPPFWRENWFGNQTLFSMFHVNEKNIPYYIEELERRNYQYFQGYPSFLYQLADYINERKIDFKGSPQAIFTSSETLFDYQRHAMEKAFRTKVFDLYGSVELVVMITQCKHGNYHFNYEYGFFEVIPIKEDDKYLVGEVIGTGFLNHAMPLLRYRLNDVVCIIKGAVCPCGKPGPVIKRIEGRVDDYVISENGSRLGLLAPIFNNPNIKEGQIVQKSPGEIILKVVKRENFSEIDETKLYYEVKRRLGHSMQVKIYYVNEIKKNKAGKFRGIISELNNGCEDEGKSFILY